VSRIWAIWEAAQADYERRRDAVVVAGRLPDDLTAARFRRRGLAGLIAWPASEPAFSAAITGAARPPWTPHADPRTQAVAETYRLLLALADHDPDTCATRSESR
jgi:hypothetical protein